MDFRIEDSAPRIRVRLGPSFVADTTRARMAFVAGRHPEYLVPTDDIRWENFALDESVRADALGTWQPVRQDNTPTAVGRRYVSGAAAGHATFEFDAMDAWFEEAEQIWFHPRDPYRRVDVRESSRDVEIRVDGETVASTHRPRLVTETALPARWYVPRADVDWTFLDDSATTSGCQYKGIAAWWNVSTADGRHADVAWGYERPIGEASKLAGLVAFYAEHAAVETLVDGVLQDRPVLDASAMNPSLGLTG